jgi:SAM-dependent methyltransferase
MASPEAAGPNAEQVRYWNEQAGPKWVELQELIDAQIAPLGRAAMERAGIRAGERVLDVGCGCGETSLELGRRVGASGSVLGVDVSHVMLERARARARAAGTAHVRFEEGDAQTHAFAPASVDVLFSRFGVMFFADPRAAFANLRRALAPDGRLAFVCWRAIPENPWMMVPMAAALQHVPPPAILAPDAPGPFAFADDARVRAILEGAGFGAVCFERHDEVLSVGGGADLDRTVAFLLQMGPTAAALREAGPELTRTVAAAVREVLVPFATPEGVRMPSGSWIVTAAAGRRA